VAFDYVLIWVLTIANSVAILLVVRRLASLSTYRPTGPRPGSSFADWTLQTLEGKSRSSAEMPLQYMLLFASETCESCHTLLRELARSSRRLETLVVAADGDAPTLRQAALTPDGPVYDEFLAGADIAFRQRFQIPGTPFAFAVRRGRVVASSPVRIPEDLARLADAARTTTATARARP
jgi:hypothetical protein